MQEVGEVMLNRMFVLSSFYQYCNRRIMFAFVPATKIVCQKKCRVKDVLQRDFSVSSIEVLGVSLCINA